jgi:hypothetical protein
MNRKSDISVPIELDILGNIESKLKNGNKASSKDNMYTRCLLKSAIRSYLFEMDATKKVKTDFD